MLDVVFDSLKSRVMMLIACPIIVALGTGNAVLWLQNRGLSNRVDVLNEECYQLRSQYEQALVDQLVTYEQLKVTVEQCKALMDYENTKPRLPLRDILDDAYINDALRVRPPGR